LVETTEVCTFTEISALTSTKTNRTLLHSANTYAGTNNAATLTWNTTYTIAKIKGTDIKFTTMAKPTAADIGAAPAVTGGYLPLSGGKMTGPLTWKDSTALPETTSS